MSSNNVGETAQAYRALEEIWSMFHALLGGTEAMRAASTTYLPKEEEELQLNYERRLENSTLFPAFESAIDRLVAKPFSGEITFDPEQLPESIRHLATNADLCGTTMEVFLRQSFTSAVTYGVGHIWVDFPSNDAENLAEERANMVVPYFVNLTAPEIIFWRFSQAHYRRLIELRFKETKTEPRGMYGDKEVVYVWRYLTDEVDGEGDRWEKYRKSDESDDYELVDEGPFTYAQRFGHLPLITYFVGKPLTKMTAAPPLKALAWSNIAHWQKQSDIDNYMRFARMAPMYFFGANDEERARLTWAPYSLIEAQNPDAKIGVVEHSGKAVGAGQDDLRRLEDRMEIQGTQPLISRSINTTATGKVIDENQAGAKVMQWITALELAGKQAIAAAGRWVGAEVDLEALALQLFRDFSVSISDENELAALMQLRQRPDIDIETLYDELKRRGIVSQHIDPMEVQAKILEESQGNAISEAEVE